MYETITLAFLCGLGALLAYFAGELTQELTGNALLGWCVGIVFIGLCSASLIAVKEIKHGRRCPSRVTEEARRR